VDDVKRNTATQYKETTEKAALERRQFILHSRRDHAQSTSLAEPANPQ
jgi:hypothetical protein